MKSFHVLLAVSWALSCACNSPESASTSAPSSSSSSPSLEIVAESQRRFTGIAVTDSGEVYVNFPRWSDDVPISVAKFDANGEPIAFPDEAWNSWTDGDDPSSAWVCVQSVHIDGRGRLWVLDPGNPNFAGVIEGAPKLVVYALPSTEPEQIYRFAEPAIKPASYLNDVRIDLERNVALITDSGDGALLVVELDSGNTRRLLDDHPSTEAEDIVLTIGGQTFDTPVHTDGLAYDASGDLVYYQSLRGRTMYRIAGAALRDNSLDPAALAARVETVAESGASDGLLFYDGRVWISALERDAIITLTPGETEPTVVITDPRIAWPDSFAAANGSVYFTTAQIHLGDNVVDPFRVWELTGF